MFGESDSESPRVPSPWDTIISTPPSPSPSPLARVAAIPKLVPEQDDGNVEYKLQLLSPSPARFARLVTQMKWRLLEGGGQAYYELGVADSGMLVGLPRAELEQSLETLDAMAGTKIRPCDSVHMVINCFEGEIGASVIVVKEIEVPAAMAGLVATQTDSWNGKRARRRQALMMGSEGSAEDDSSATSTATNTETEPELSATDVDDDDEEDLSSTVLLDLSSPPKYPRRVSTGGGDVFSMDDVEGEVESSDADADTESPPPPTQFSIDLEIASVFKPRPVRTKASPDANAPLPKINKRAAKLKKGKHPHLPDSLNSFARAPSADYAHHVQSPDYVKPTKAQNRRQARDRKREERRAALMVYATAALQPQSGVAELDPRTQVQSDAACAMTDAAANDIVSGLEALHVGVEVSVPAVLVSEPAIPSLELNTVPSLDLDADVFLSKDNGDEEEDDDVFPSPMTATRLTVPTGTENSARAQEGVTRLIVEALVVRKMSLEEAFLDFGGFSFSPPHGHG
ncbi:GTP-binding protein 2 [Mycena venus]|uniref:GTP-binding protein 2 n=1 Tax=Mycena venus TaxID=2733690 RepID=A0A8H6U188_9AGAR|nr:GTP-binding protein 2 [Mycena venus]